MMVNLNCLNHKQRSCRASQTISEAPSGLSTRLLRLAAGVIPLLSTSLVHFTQLARLVLVYAVIISCEIQCR